MSLSNALLQRFGVVGQAAKKKTQSITWIGPVIKERPEKMEDRPKFPARDLRLDFEIIDRSTGSDTDGLDLNSIRLTADFPFHKLPPNTNLYKKRFVTKDREDEELAWSSPIWFFKTRKDLAATVERARNLPKLYPEGPPVEKE